ncbi:transcriptional regulator [Bacillus coahuilensis m2-6]|uniref:Transcriptional regulator n=1 Tax=Bacillus coahuilensis p1.1.43 TaxID=1150625 RepID=A0A147K481_9BACI|nr:helix-turn-helix domain-containing protein [Bacillus coahuilensis]KUP04130.1 transcriptional regulator [Bacillus coahuilensis p1.1.43]KUP05114.1 transcriptional regulator [Bacillus coahuilensis m2-6]
MIGERVKQLRLEKNMSMTELAERAGVAKSYLSAIERNLQKNPSVQFLEKVAQALGVSMDSILFNQQEDKQAVDPDWLDIVHQAQDSGITKEQFKEFIEFNKWRKNQK